MAHRKCCEEGPPIDNEIGCVCPCSVLCVQFRCKETALECALRCSCELVPKDSMTTFLFWMFIAAQKINVLPGSRAHRYHDFINGCQRQKAQNFRWSSCLWPVRAPTSWPACTSPPPHTQDNSCQHMLRHRPPATVIYGGGRT